MNQSSGQDDIGTSLPGLPRRPRILRRGLLLLAAGLVVAAGTGVAAGTATYVHGSAAAVEVAGPTAPTGSSGPAVAVGDPHTSAPTHRISYQGVIITVPAQWAPASGDSDGSGLCLTDGGVPMARGASGTNDNCQLVIRVVREPGSSGVDDPFPLGNGNGSQCGSAGPAAASFATRSADNVTIAGESSEHHVFAGSCFTGGYENWVLADSTAVVFSRYDSNGNAAAVSAALRTVRLPAPRGLRVQDRGGLCWMSSGYNPSVAIDRTTTYYEPDFGVRYVSSDPQTYRYDLVAATPVRALRHGRVIGLTVADLRDIESGRTVHGVTENQVDRSVTEVSTNGKSVTGVEIELDERAPAGICR